MDYEQEYHEERKARYAAQNLVVALEARVESVAMDAFERSAELADAFAKQCRDTMCYDHPHDEIWLNKASVAEEIAKAIRATAKFTKQDAEISKEARIAASQ